MGGGVGRFCSYLFVLLREILVRDMGFVQCVVGGAGRDQMIYFRGNCV